MRQNTHKVQTDFVQSFSHTNAQKIESLVVNLQLKEKRSIFARHTGIF